MGQELQLPDWAKNGAVGMSRAFAVLNPADDSLSEGIGQSYPVIGYKGKVWSFRFRGERKNFIRPDDGTPAAYLDVIILGQAKQKSKSYYKAYDPNDSGDRPICSSIDGVTPDPDVTTKQADACALCPMNVWKTDPQTGKKGRACSDYKRLAVLVLPTQSAPINNGEPVLEPAFLRVPAGSLNSLAIMGDTMAAQGFHYASYITRITFDPNESHPKMIFRPLQGLTDNEAPMILKLREDMQVERIVHGGFSEAQRVPPQAGTTLLPPGGQRTGLEVLQALSGPGPSTVAASPPPATTMTTATQQPTPASVSTGLGSAPLATPAGVNPAPANPTGISTGLAGLSTTPPGATISGGATLAATPPPSQTVGDAGAPEATDDDLDAMIAKSIKH